ncbi:MAG: hypothetical protein IT374_26385 [Polyangiaceae bacterium]|nr:hypothetical protein [Polyangiaceae bacterium]
MIAPAADAILDPSRRWRVVLRHHQAGQFGAFQFGAGGVVDVAGGRLLYRLVVAFGPDVESITEIVEQQASTPEPSAVVSPAAPVPAAPADDRTEAIAALRAEGLSWAQIGDRMGISRERARQLGRGPRDVAEAPASP